MDDQALTWSDYALAVLLFGALVAWAIWRDRRNACIVRAEREIRWALGVSDVDDTIYTDQKLTDRIECHVRKLEDLYQSACRRNEDTLARIKSTRKFPL